jgi:hypothetical protein
VKRYHDNQQFQDSDWSPAQDRPTDSWEAFFTWTLSLGWIVVMIGLINLFAWLVGYYG